MATPTAQTAPGSSSGRKEAESSSSSYRSPSRKSTTFCRCTMGTHILPTSGPGRPSRMKISIPFPVICLPRNAIFYLICCSFTASSPCNHHKKRNITPNTPVGVCCSLMQQLQLARGAAAAKLAHDLILLSCLRERDSIALKCSPLRAELRE